MEQQQDTIERLVAKVALLKEQLAASEAKVAALTAISKRKLPDEQEETDVVPSKKQMLHAMQTLEDGVVHISSVDVCPHMPTQMFGESAEAFMQRFVLYQGNLEAYQRDLRAVTARCHETLAASVKMDRAMKAEHLLNIVARKSSLYYCTALELLPEHLFCTAENFSLCKTLRLKGTLEEESPMYLKKLLKNMQRFAGYFKHELQEPMWLAAVNALVSSSTETLQLFVACVTYDLGPLALVDEALHRTLPAERVRT